MAPLLAKYLRAWQVESCYTKPTDWVFASEKTRGRTPRVGNMLCVVLRRSMRHAGSGIMLDLYAQTDREELIAAQELMLEAIFRHADGAVQ